MDESLLARVIGFLFSDGCLYQNLRNQYYEISFSLGEIEDVEELKADLEHLGALCHIKEQSNQMTISGRKFRIHTFMIKIISKELFGLFQKLGAPVGKKTDISYEAPKWIMNGSKSIQKEFLKGYLGGDGPKVCVFMQKRKHKKDYNSFKINDIEFYKRIDLTHNGVHFAEQLAILLSGFNIKIGKIFSKGSFRRKNGTYSTSIHIQLRQDVESLLEYSRIGFAYCNQKKTATNKVKSFLEEISGRRIEWKRKYEDALSLYKQGIKIKDIATRLGISYAAVFGWIRYNRKPTIEKHYLKFDKWGETNASVE